MSPKYSESERGTPRPHWSLEGLRIVTEGFPADPLLTDLARLLADPRIPDAYVESVRACIREHCYQLRLIAEKEAA